MRLVADDGQLVSVRRWPLAGLNYGADLTGNGTISLTRLSNGLDRNATYRAVYRSNPWVYAAVNAKAWGVSRLPLKTYRLDGDANRHRIRGDLPGSVGRPSGGQHLDNLLRYPEPRKSRQEWLRQLGIDYGIHGNALAILERRGELLPQSLAYTAWHKVVVHEGQNLPIKSYEVIGDRDSRFFAPEDVIHFGKGGDPESPLGQSPLESCQHTLALYEAMLQHLVKFFENSARPSGLLQVKPEAARDKKILDSIREQVRALYSSADNAGKVLITSAEWQSLSESPDQSQIIELVKLSREEVAAAYHVPPPVLGILDRAIMGNVRELRSQMIRDVVGPLAQMFEGDLMAQLVHPIEAYRYHFVEFDPGQQLQPDVEARAQAYAELRRILTIDEIRALENRSPLNIAGHSDRPVMSSGDVPLGTSQRQRPVTTE